jgi:hypothetical protein
MVICPICKTKWLSGFGGGGNENRRDRGDSAKKCYLCWGLEEPEERLRGISKKTIKEHKEKIRG